MAPRRLLPRADAGLWCSLCCGCWLLGGAGEVWANDALPAGPELTLTAPRATGIGGGRGGARTLREAVLDLQMRSPGSAVDTGRWQFTLQRYEQPWQPGLAPAPGSVAVGVYMKTGGRAQFGWQSRPLGPRDSVAASTDAALGRAPNTMTLRSADPLADLRLGALAKFSLGDQTSISLRPRKGGVRLYLQAQW